MPELKNLYPERNDDKLMERLKRFNFPFLINFVWNKKDIHKKTIATTTT